MSTFFRHCRSYFPRSKRGFTLVELLLVMAVITIVTSVILFNQNKFNSSTLLRSLGYSVALTLRQAQVFGTSVRGFTPQGAAAPFARGYGAYISSGDRTHMYLFADVDGNGALDTSPTDERLFGTGAGTLTLGKGYTVSKFCAVVNDTMQDCYPSGVGGGQAVTSLTIYFTRPNPDACIATSVVPSACSPGGTQVYTGAYIEVSSGANSDVRAVRVTNTGQIVVCQLNANPLTC